MKIRSLLCSETRAISFNCCQSLLDLLLSYERNVNNSEVDDTDWPRHHFIFFSCSWSQIILYINTFFQMMPSFFKGCSERCSKQCLKIATNQKFFSNFKHFQWTILLIEKIMYKSIFFQGAMIYQMQTGSLASSLHC